MRKIFARISRNLPEKFLCGKLSPTNFQNFCHKNKTCRPFFGGRRTTFLWWIKRQIQTFSFSQSQWSHKQNKGVKASEQEFSTIKTFGGALAPPAPTPQLLITGEPLRRGFYLFICSYFSLVARIVHGDRPGRFNKNHTSFSPWVNFHFNPKARNLDYSYSVFINDRGCASQQQT